MILSEIACCKVRLEYSDITVDVDNESVVFIDEHGNACSLSHDSFEDLIAVYYEYTGSQGAE